MCVIFFTFYSLALSLSSAHNPFSYMEYVCILSFLYPHPLNAQLNYSSLGKTPGVPLMPASHVDSRPGKQPSAAGETLACPDGKRFKVKTFFPDS